MNITITSMDEDDVDIYFLQLNHDDQFVFHSENISPFEWMYDAEGCVRQEFPYILCLLTWPTNKSQPKTGWI
jgi:hypothetical protein